ncbi:hypothetical protein CEP52_017817, partial [Fusarium oligoseptatum]
IFGEESLSFITYDRKLANIAGLQRFETPCTVVENLNAIAIKTPLRLYFSSAKVLELFTNSYDTAPFKDIEQRYRARFVLLRHIDGEKIICSFQLLWPKPLASLLERVSRIMTFA